MTIITPKMRQNGAKWDKLTANESEWDKLTANQMTHLLYLYMNKLSYTISDEGTEQSSQNNFMRNAEKTTGGDVVEVAKAASVPAITEPKELSKAQINQIGVIAYGLEPWLKSIASNSSTGQRDWTELWGDTLANFVKECNNVGYHKFLEKSAIKAELLRQCRYLYKVEGICFTVPKQVNEAVFAIQKLEKELNRELGKAEAVGMVFANRKNRKAAEQIVEDAWFIVRGSGAVLNGSESIEMLIESEQ